MAADKDLNVGANLYPTESGVAELGNSTKKWIIDASQLTGTITASTATTATKLGSATVGGTAKPIYLSSGVATACSSTVGSSNKPAYLNNGTITACSSTVGSATQPVYMKSGTITATSYTLGKSVPSNAVFTDTDTHYTSKNVIGASTATSNTTSALGNGNVYLNSVENNAITSSHKISGSGATTVTTDTSGNLIISSTNTDTTYYAGVGITLNGTTFNNSGVRSISTGSNNGTISVDTGGTSTEISVKGLGSAAYTASTAYASASHTHNYAGSSSAGGVATSAAKLSTSAGSSTQPVYFSNGVPKACSYTLNKTVPSNAIFTDTNTWIAMVGATTSAAGTAGYVPAPSAGAATRYLRCDGTWTAPPDTNTTYSAATTSAAGLMSAADKTKLNGIATGANAYTLPTATSSVLGGVKIGSNITVSSGTISLTKANVTSALGYTPPEEDTDTTYRFTFSDSSDGTSDAPNTENGNVHLNLIQNDDTVRSWYSITGTNAASVMTDSNGDLVIDASYETATESQDGLMSSADKSKLDNLIVVSTTEPTSSECKLWIAI